MGVMSRHVLLLATFHQFQGPRFSGYIQDEPYRILVEKCISVRRIDLVFEEAGKREPSTAEESANSVLGPGHYLNMDHTRNALRKFGITEDVETETGHWIDDRDKSLGKYCCEDIGAHNGREMQWLRAIEAQQFEKGLVILGVGHSLSFAFRLHGAGFAVELCQYLPYEKLCKREHSK